MCAGFSQCPRGGAQGAHEELSGAQGCQGQQQLLQIIFT
jgi:hypothetical protein